MSSVETIQKISTAFLWPSQEALPLMKNSIKDDSYANAFESRFFFIVQAISSVVAIPFILIASFFILLWKLSHCDTEEAFYTIPSAIIGCARHLNTAISSLIASISPMGLINKNIDSLHIEKIEPQQEAQV